MADIVASTLGTALQQLLLCDDIQPGSEPSYQLCKTIYEMHPLGAKMAKYPVRMAMSQSREISIPKAPEQAVEAFWREWRRLGCETTIANLTTLSRVYGAAAVAMVVKGVSLDKPIDPTTLYDADIAFNVLDPLNISGSLVASQDPTTLSFQRIGDKGIAIAGHLIHPSRCLTLLNEEPIYIGYTSSAFGYVGRSVYQRALFSLKTFLQTTITDDLVVVKSGVLVATMKAAGSIINNAMAQIMGQKRNVVKEARVGNVISIGEGESIQSIDMKNLEGPFALARKHALENSAAAADMPAKILNSETYAEGFGEGTEDAKGVALYIDGLRETMRPAYDFFDPIVMRRAWSPQFYKTIQELYPEDYGSVDYDVAFYDWTNSFSAIWPSLLTEPESEKVKTDDVKLKAIIAAYQVLVPNLDPENKARAVMWLQDNFNANKRMFGTPLDLDFDALREYEPQIKASAGDGEIEPEEPKPFSAQDAQAPRLRIAAS